MQLHRINKRTLLADSSRDWPASGSMLVYCYFEIDDSNGICLALLRANLSINPLQLRRPRRAQSAANFPSRPFCPLFCRCGKQNSQSSLGHLQAKFSVSGNHSESFLIAIVSRCFCIQRKCSKTRLVKGEFGHYFR